MRADARRKSHAFCKAQIRLWKTESAIGENSFAPFLPFDSRNQKEETETGKNGAKEFSPVSLSLDEAQKLVQRQG